jgi:hypothetical protein
MERTGTCLDVAIREDELCGHGEHAKRVLFPDGMWVLRCLKHQGVRGEQRNIPGGTEGENVQNGFRLHHNTYVGFCIEWTLHTAHVKVDFHAKNVPAVSLSSKMLGGKGLTSNYAAPSGIRDCNAPKDGQLPYFTPKGRYRLSKSLMTAIIRLTQSWEDLYSHRPLFTLFYCCHPPKKTETTLPRTILLS